MGVLIYPGYECTNKRCWAGLRPSNAATNFSNPALAVRIAVEREIIRKGQNVLELGAGNLRNALFILETIPDVHISCYDLKATIERFGDKYKRFRRLGGEVVETGYRKRKYDIVVCSFVLETICPEKNRVLVLKSMRSVLEKRGVFVGSFRGYPGVVGSRYRKCPLGEGLVTPLHTFVRPYSIPELHDLLLSSGFSRVAPLQTYRVEKPKNIHVLAGV